MNFSEKSAQIWGAGWAKTCKIWPKFWFPDDQVNVYQRINFKLGICIEWVMGKNWLTFQKNLPKFGVSWRLKLVEFGQNFGFMTIKKFINRSTLNLRYSLKWLGLGWLNLLKDDHSMTRGQQSQQTYSVTCGRGVRGRLRLLLLLFSTHFLIEIFSILLVY